MIPTRREGLPHPPETCFPPAATSAEGRAWSRAVSMIGLFVVRAREGTAVDVCLAPGERRCWAGLGVLLILLGACRGSPEPAGTGDAGHAEQKSPHRIRVAPDVLRDAGIEVGPVAKEALSPSLTLPGEVVAIP